MPPIVVVLLLLTTPTVLANSSPSTTSPQNNIPDIVFTNRNNQTDKYSKQHKYIDGSMEPVYSVAKQIINIFVGQRIPDDLILMLRNVIFKTESVTNENALISLLTHYWILSSVVIGSLLFAVILPIFGYSLIFWCRKAKSVDQKNHKCRRVFLGLLMIFLCTGLILGIVVVFVTNYRLQNGAEILTSTTESAVSDAQLYLSSTISEINYLTNENLDELIKYTSENVKLAIDNQYDPNITLNFDEQQEKDVKYQTIKVLKDHIDKSSTGLRELSIKITTMLNKLSSDIEKSKNANLPISSVCIAEYVPYFYWTSFAIGSVLLVVLMCLVCGLLFGICGKSFDEYDGDDCCSKDAGSRCLKFGVGIIHLSVSALTLCSLAYFLVGIILERGVCTPLKHHKTDQIFELVDQNINLNTFLKTVADGKFIPVKVPLRISQVIESCHQNISIYNALRLDTFFDFDTLLKLPEPDSYISKTIKKSIISYVSKAKNDVGLCNPLSNAYNSMLVATCNRIVDPLNGLWLGLSYCIMLFIPLILVAIRLASLDQISNQDREHPEDSEFTFDSKRDRELVPLTEGPPRNHHRSSEADRRIEVERRMESERIRESRNRYSDFYGEDTSLPPYRPPVAPRDPRLDYIAIRYSRDEPPRYNYLRPPSPQRY